MIMQFLTRAVSSSKWRCAAPFMGLVASSYSSTLAQPPSKLKVALCQMPVGFDKTVNIATAKAAIENAATSGAQLVCLPESWNCPYGTKYFDDYAESVPDAGGTASDPSVQMLVQVAKEHKVYVCGGTVPERENGKLYNTCVSIGPDGKVLAKHRKMHLFDIDIPGKQTFRESDVLTGGDSVTMFDTPWGKCGVGICYDLRFPELAMIMRAEGCKILLYPGCFNTVTGPKHWELLQRARAVDNQCFVVTCSQSRDPDFEYQAYGHSMVVDPWAKVIATTGDLPDTVFAELDLQEVETFRTNVPITLQKRYDVYTKVEKQSKL